VWEDGLVSDLDALLAGIVAHPHEHVRWLIVADWLDDHDQPDRAELLRLHRLLIDTCCEPDAHPEREGIHARMMDLMRAGAEPCVPRHSLPLPGGVGLPMVFLPPGSFRMGSPRAEASRSDDEATHPVTLTRGFHLGESPVTQRQWAAVMGDDPSEFKGDDRPVEMVSWDDATAFCGAASGSGVSVRLPTEAEWEYACRSGTTTPFYWGGALNGTEAHCSGWVPYGTKARGRSREATAPVGSYAAVSPHPWGLFDCHGNVWEWCADWFDGGYYGRSPVENPRCDDGPQRWRVLRGGSWIDAPNFCRAAYRSRYGSDHRDHRYGFRVAVTLD
jgi:uncharacterized protein (TIGR02996 family)